MKEKGLNKIDNSNLLKTHNFLKNKNTNDVLYAQFKATESVFYKRKYLLGV